MFCEKVWAFWLNLRLVMNEVEPIFCFVSKEKKINPRILLASSYRLTKIWTVKFKFFLQRQKMPELIPGERGTVMSGKAAGRESQLFFHARHCSLWGRLTCVYGRSEKKWTKKAVQSVEVGTAYRFAQFFIFLFFFPQRLQTNQQRQLQYISVI